MNAPTRAFPGHVPKELVKEFDYIRAPGMSSDPFRGVAALHKGLPVFFNPLQDRHDGIGTWDVIKAEYIREVLGNPEVFSSKGESGFSQLVNEDWMLIPLEIDPPDHTKYRTFLNPLVSPVAIKKLSAKIEGRAEELIRGFANHGGCEFMEAFGRPFPVTIIMELVGLPLSELDTFLKWECDLLHDPDLQTKSVAAAQIRDYLRDLIKEKRANPVDDFVSFIVTQELDGKKLTDIECLGICYLLFVGGLDTVASSLGFHYQYLAEHLDKQSELRRDPAKIPNAVEQLLRRFSVVTTYRRLTRDFNFHGAPMREGDWVTVPMPLASVDPAEAQDPFNVDLTSRSRHVGFSFGPHFCMGSHIARRELIIALEKWTEIVPEFRVKSGTQVKTHGGIVFGVDHLELEW